MHFGNLGKELSNSSLSSFLFFIFANLLMFAQHLLSDLGLQQRMIIFSEKLWRPSTLALTSVNVGFTDNILSKLVAKGVISQILHQSYIVLLIDKLIF